jgi:parvulin-like peptidyl-prolyl isomerase
MKSLFRRICITALFFSAALYASGCAKHPMGAEPVVPLSGSALLEAKKTVVAKVNGADITRYALINMSNRMTEINLKTSTSVSREETGKKALDQLIFQELAYQEAVRQGLHVEQPNIDRGIDNLKLKLGGEKQFQDFLAKGSLTMEELRSQVERLLLIDLIVTREVKDKVSVPDDAIRNEYELHKGKYVTPEKITVVDVVFFLNLDDAASMTKANDILAKINTDQDKNPMNLVPDKTFFIRDLDLDKEQEPSLYSAARKLTEGQLSGVIQGSDSIHIIKLTKNTPERQMSYEEVKGSIEEKLRAAMIKERRQKWERELKKGAKIELF